MYNILRLNLISLGLVLFHQERLENVITHQVPQITQQNQGAVYPNVHQAWAKKFYT